MQPVMNSRAAVEVNATLHAVITAVPQHEFIHAAMVANVLRVDCLLTFVLRLHEVDGPLKEPVLLSDAGDDLEVVPVNIVDTLSVPLVQFFHERVSHRTAEALKMHKLLLVHSFCGISGELVDLIDYLRVAVERANCQGHCLRVEKLVCEIIL